MKIRILLLFLTVGLWANAQVSPAPVVRVATATTAFGTNLPKGAIIIDVATGKQYVAIAGVADTKTINTALEGTAVIREIGAAEDLNGAALGTTTATSGNILIGDGDSWESTPVTGDVTITSGGVTAIGNDKITAAMINADAAGSGVVQNATTGALDVNPGNTLVVANDTIGINLAKANTWTGTQTFDNAVVTSADINGGSIDGTAIGSGTAATGAFTTLSSSDAATLNSASVTTNATIGGTLGVTGAASFDGTIKIKETGDTPTHYTTLQGGDQGADITYTLPAASPTAGQVLSSDASGVMSWTTPAATPTPVVQSFDVSTDSAANTNYTLSGTSLSATGVTVSLNGLVLKTAQYEVSGTTLTIKVPVYQYDVVTASYLN